MTLNRQLMFDTAVAALYKQGEQSMSPTDSDMCAYRGADGMKCALGHCIPDTRYDAALEGMTGVDEPVMEAIHSDFGVADQRRLRDDPSAPGDPEFLQDLQQDLHDNYFRGADQNQTYREYLKAQATIFATKYGLEVDVNLFTLTE